MAVQATALSHKPGHPRSRYRPNLHLYQPNGHIVHSLICFSLFSSSSGFSSTNNYFLVQEITHNLMSMGRCVSAFPVTSQGQDATPLQFPGPKQSFQHREAALSSQLLGHCVSHDLWLSSTKSTLVSLCRVEIS
jgi:hypothetical protein